MTITHHPSDGALAAFAAGTLDEANAVVVAVHVSLCPRCRTLMAAFERLGGMLIEGLEPAQLSDGALDRALAGLDTREPVSKGRPAAALADPGIPVSLVPYGLGPWRWIGRGVHWRSVQVPSEAGARVFMLRAEPGTRLPHHRHSGTEWTCILEGAFRHDLGRYGSGDFDEADDTVEHKPVVEEGVACVCLVALQGRIEFQGWLGRMLQPFVRI